MSLIQALLIGVFAYLGRNQVPWLFGTTGGFYCVGRPLVAGAIVGLILGDVTTGVLCGVAVQAMYLGQIVAGGAMPSDVNYAAFIGIPLAMVAGGGAEAAITPLAIGGFTAMKALSESADPARASIPFDKERSGFIMGEGAGALFLEEYEHAVRRGAPIYAEILGYGASCDAHHITAPDPTGSGGAACMLGAVSDGGIRPEDMDYINAHGTSTPMNDRCETLAIRKAFGAHADKLMVSSTKSMTGHLLGAAGAVEAIFTAVALRDGYVPATIGYQTPDEECDLDIVPNTGRETSIRYALSNSLGFGGHNSALLFKRWEA